MCVCVSFVLSLLGVRVTASVVESRARNKDGRHKTYLGEVFIATHDLQVRISPYDIRLNGLSLSWKIEKSLGTHHVRVVITGSKYHVAVIINNSTQMLIQRYLYAVKNPKQVNYLNFYVTDHTGLSTKTTGLLGKKFNEYFSHSLNNESDCTISNLILITDFKKMGRYLHQTKNTPIHNKQ